jgi:4-coumarate--CoA ligase
MIQGLQVAPAELEALLLTHPQINDAAVVGVYDDSRATEVPRAFVVVEPGSQLSAHEIISFVRDNLANHKWLRGGVVFVDEIPKSASGKILRKELRARDGSEEVLKAKI